MTSERREASTGPSGDVYDRGQALAVTGGNARIADELLSLLLRELPAQEAALLELNAGGDEAGLAELAHKLQGSATYCGTPALKAAALALEHAAQARVPPEAVEAARRHLVGEIQRLRQALTPTGAGAGDTRSPGTPS